MSSGFTSPVDPLAVFKSSPNHTPVGYPFDNPIKSDVALRSSDSKTFYVYRNILEIASPFFANLFTIKQPPQTPFFTPAIDVSETSRTLDCLLRMCYPVADPTFISVAEVDDVMRAAVKYGIKFVIESCTKSLHSHVHGAPLQVFAVACHHQKEVLAKAAATRWREVLRPGTVSAATQWEATPAARSYLDALSGLSAAHFFRLLKYLITGQNSIAFCTPDVPTKAEPPSFVFPHYPDADLILQSYDNLYFRVHKVILSVTSKTLGDAVQSTTTQLFDGKEWPVCNIPLNSTILCLLLRLTYPGGWGADLDSVDVWTLGSVLSAAKRYDIPNAVAYLSMKISEHRNPNPLEVYFIAQQNDLLSEAREAAKLASAQSLLQLYTPRMEEIDVSLFYRLLKFRHAFRALFYGDGSSVNAIDEYWTDNGNQGSTQDLKDSFSGKRIDGHLPHLYRFSKYASSNLGSEMSMYSRVSEELSKRASDLQL